LKSEWIAPGGRATKEFEKRFANYLSGGYAIAVDSGTSALHLALLALGVKKGDEVILPTYTCSAVLNAVNYVGATPVIVDINPNDFNISFERTLKKITEKTKAIIAPHMYGIPIANIRQFTSLNIPIIEDASQSIGTKINGQMTGTFGKLSTFSFGATKLMTTAKGGAVFSKDKKLIDNIKDLVDYDFRPTYRTRYNQRMTDFQAALGISQLKKLPRFLKRRREIAHIYGGDFARKGRVYYRYVMLTKDPKAVKKEFFREGVTVINPLEIWELLHNYIRLNKTEFPNAEKAAHQTVSIPIYPSLTDSEVAKIRGVIDGL